jgi:cytochrome P450 PksS
MILPMLASANHDPKIFEDPDQFLPERDSKKHVAFGKGVHVCLGAPLARIEGQEILKSLLHHKPNLNISLTEESLNWRQDIALRGLISLPVTS